MLRTKSRTLGHGVERRWRSSGAFAVALAVLAGTAACGSNGGVQTEVPIASAESITPTATATETPAVEDAILAAYRGFFAAQTDISHSPAGERRAMLEPLATEPALSRVLRGMLAADELGEVGYGQEVLDPRVTKVDGDEADISDCQDTSGIGRKKRKTGTIVTRGTPHAAVEATLRRGEDGIWRVATVEYGADKC